jgi:hypothetical protein
LSSFYIYTRTCCRYDARQERLAVLHHQPGTQQQQQQHNLEEPFVIHVVNADIAESKKQHHLVKDRNHSPC